jgi:hypothetical protein
MKNSPLRTAALLAFGLFPMAGAMPGATQALAQAQAQAYDPKAAELCTPDVMRLCNEFVPDVDLITGCMHKNRRQLSPECAAVFKPKRRRHAPVKAD